MSSRTISRFLSDPQIRAFIKTNGQFLRLLNNNFMNTQNTNNFQNIKKKEYEWGVSKIIKYNIPINGALKFWSGPLGEHYVYSKLSSSGNTVKRPCPINGFTPDWECENFIYEVKTRNYTSTGSIGEKALGIPLKYCDIPELYRKPLKIVLVGKMEMEGIYKYGIINKNVENKRSINKSRIIQAYKNIGIEYVGASDL